MLSKRTMKEPYTRRDYLAVDRTHLANERTLLAFWRTTLAFLILGAFLLKFFPSASAIMLAMASIVFGGILFVLSIGRYFWYKQKIDKR